MTEIIAKQSEIFHEVLEDLKIIANKKDPLETVQHKIRQPALPLLKIIQEQEGGPAV